MYVHKNQKSILFQKKKQLMLKQLSELALTLKRLGLCLPRVRAENVLWCREAYQGKEKHYQFLDPVLYVSRMLQQCATTLIPTRPVKPSKCLFCCCILESNLYQTALQNIYWAHILVVKLCCNKARGGKSYPLFMLHQTIC